MRTCLITSILALPRCLSKVRRVKFKRFLGSINYALAGSYLTLLALHYAGWKGLDDIKDYVFGAFALTLLAKAIVEQSRKDRAGRDDSACA